MHAPDTQRIARRIARRIAAVALAGAVAVGGLIASPYVVRVTEAAAETISPSSPAVGKVTTHRGFHFHRETTIKRHVRRTYHYRTVTGAAYHAAERFVFPSRCELRVWEDGSAILTCEDFD